MNSPISQRLSHTLWFPAVFWNFLFRHEKRSHETMNCLWCVYSCFLTNYGLVHCSWVFSISVSKLKKQNSLSTEKEVQINWFGIQRFKDNYLEAHKHLEKWFENRNICFKVIWNLVYIILDIKAFNWMPFFMCSLLDHKQTLTGSLWVLSLKSSISPPFPPLNQETLFFIWVYCIQIKSSTFYIANK